MSEKRYIVMIDDNFHYMDEDHRYKHGEFSTYKEAVKACERILNEELEDMRKQGVEEEKLSSIWSMFGSDPFIMDEAESNRFSSREYVTDLMTYGKV